MAQSETRFVLRRGVWLPALLCCFGGVACSSDEGADTAPAAPPFSTVDPAPSEAAPEPSGSGGTPSESPAPGEGIEAAGSAESGPDALPLKPSATGEPPAAGSPDAPTDAPLAEGPPPFVFGEENTGSDCAEPALPALDQLVEIPELPDPFLSATGERITRRADWRCARRAVAARVQRYEMGDKPPRPTLLDASLDGDVLSVTAGEAGSTLTISAALNRPAGAPPGPLPLVIGVAGRTGSLPSDIFDSRGIASLAFSVQQVAGQFPGRGAEPYNQVFGADTDAGAIIAWAWGISRIIDALEELPEAGIDLSRIAVTGCSFAGKIALYAGAFDERIRLTIPEESGGGGTANWRVSEDERSRGTDTENLSTAQGTAWYHRDLPQFNAAVARLPFDHHQVIGMVAPRALLAVESSSSFYPRLSHVSTFTSGLAAHRIWEALGVPERMGMTQVSTNHCQFPASQRGAVEAFVDRFLLDQTDADTNVLESDAITADLARWAPWETPALQ